MININDLHWAAGFLDGEGAFGISHGQPQVCASQKDTWALFKLAKLFQKGQIFRCDIKNREEKLYKPSYRWAVTSRCVAAIMMTLYPLLSPYRQTQIRKVLTAWVQSPPAKQNRWGYTNHYRKYVLDCGVVWTDPTP